MFTCVGIGSPFILVTVAVLCSMLQKQYMLQVQFLVVLLVVFKFLSSRFVRALLLMFVMIIVVRQ